VIASLWIHKGTVASSQHISNLTPDCNVHSYVDSVGGFDMMTEQVDLKLRNQNVPNLVQEYAPDRCYSPKSFYVILSASDFLKML
jgi:hypothetical protein